jgi:hypothetical protein
MTPACMTPAELAGWAAANRRLRRRAGLPCVDCPASFAAQMRAVGCCNGIPGGLGGPRKDPVLPKSSGQGIRYATDEERRAARRRSWREYRQRVRARAA